MILTLVMVMAATPAATPGIGVLDFGAQGGASTELAAALSTLTSQELERMGTFRVSSNETMRVMLGVERQRLLMGCENCSGTSLADLANYEFVISGKVLKTKSDFTLFLSLVPVGATHASSSAKVTATSESALMQEVRPTVITLMSKVLEGRQGTLMISTSEVGADVKIDERQVGTTPLEPMVLAAGPHLVTIQKDGFSQVRKEVRIAADQVSDESFRLVPSPDTILAYETNAKRLRVLAWAAGGLAVAGFALAIIAESQSARIYGDTNSVDSFQYARAQLLAQDESYRAKATELKAQVETWSTLSMVGIAVGAAGAVTSAVLFIVGDNPAKYDQYHRLKPSPSANKPTVSLAPTLGGVVLSGTF